MKKTSLVLIITAAALLFGIKTFYPAAAQNARELAASVFSMDINYRQVINRLADAVPAFGGGEEERVEEDGGSRLVLQNVEPALTTLSVGERECGENSGEIAVISYLPPAVTAFLESQKEYSELSLPENVTYDYQPYPAENAVPVSGYNSSGFGYRLHPIKGDIRFHYGTDFAANSGEAVLAFSAGTVETAGWSDSYGNYIVINHAEGWQSLYAHCSTLFVESGDEVSAGERIALVGDTGLATGPHLHFELSKDGVYTNPEYYVN